MYFLSPIGLRVVLFIDLYVKACMPCVATVKADLSLPLLPALGSRQRSTLKPPCFTMGRAPLRTSAQALL